jgi:hypothetical protein
LADNLHPRGTGKVRDFAGEIAGIESGAREEIDRPPMPQPQRQRRSAVQRECGSVGVDV